MPNEDLLNLLTDPCQAAEDVVSRLQELERYFSSKRDLRGVFATAYLQISKATYLAKVDGNDFFEWHLCIILGLLVFWDLVGLEAAKATQEAFFILPYRRTGLEKVNIQFINVSTQLIQMDFVDLSISMNQTEEADRICTDFNLIVLSDPKCKRTKPLFD